MKALSKLTMNGGPGQTGVQNINGAILTVQETIAKTIAQDMIDDAVRRHKKPLKELSLMQLNEGIDERVKGRLCSKAHVLREIGALANAAYYG